MAGGSNATWAHALKLDSTLSPFDSPLAKTHSAFADIKPVSWERRNIAGLLVTLYGLQELPRDVNEVTCLWLLHGRGDTQDSMAYTAAALLAAWYDKRKEGQKHVIAINFDQRNHGSRSIDNKANVSWKQGNPTHGPDMYNLFGGTASDVSLLISNMPSYLPFDVAENICCGVSLGGHATWQLLMNEPRVNGGIVVIGCPDYARLMTDRAIRSKLATTTDTDPPGLNFIGSKDFPDSLVKLLTQQDPAGKLLSHRPMDNNGFGFSAYPAVEAWDQIKIRNILKSTLGNKKILCLSGGKDRLVPYACGKPFLQVVKDAIEQQAAKQPNQSLGIELDVVVDPEAGHEFSATMRKDAEKWLCDVLAGERGTTARGSKL